MTNSDSSHDGDTATTPMGHKLRSARTTFRFASSRLSLVQNPLAPEGEEGEHLIHPGDHEHDHGHGHGHKLPPPDKVGDHEESPLQFRKREAASTSELFYDLWFVANLNVFATVHPIVDINNLVSFVSYFLLLWITWLVTTVHDARFGQDGILQRLARACHLGVMMGFAVAGVSFDQSGIIAPIYRAMSYCLMSSRIVLAIQYSTVLYHARHHHRSRIALLSAVVIHVLPAVVYLVCALLNPGVADKHLLAIWYVAGLAEMIAVVLHSTLSKTLSFEGTHFNERLNLLTLIILGEGVIILSKNITKIVEYTWIKGITDTWSSALCGMITCAAAIIYITFQLYFDWMHHHNHMKAINQMFWTVIHLPFHIVLVLLAEGSGQWVLWWRAIESYRGAEKKLIESLEKAADSESTKTVISALNSTAYELLYKYGSDIAKKGGDSAKDLEKTMKQLLTIPDTFWDSEFEKHSGDTYDTFHRRFTTVSSIVINAISDAFGLSYMKEAKKSDAKTSGGEEDIETAELAAVLMTTKRLVLIFIYVFLSAAFVIILLMLMHLLSKRKGWTIFNMFRTATVFLIGVGLGLVALIGTNSVLTQKFLLTPWQLPTITICFFVVLILTHVPHPPRIFIKRSEVDSMEMGTVGKEGQKLAPPDVGRGSSLKRGLTTIRRTAGNIRIEAGAYDPISEDHHTLETKGTINSYNLYRV